MASMVEAYRQNGVSLNLLALNTRKHFRSPELIRANVPEGLRLEVIPANTNITLPRALKNLVDGKAFHVSRFFNAKFAHRLRVLLQTEHWDMVQLDGLSMGVYLDVIRANSNAKVVYRAHNLEYEIWNRHADTLPNPLKKNYLRLQVRRLHKFERYVLTESDGVLPITAEDEKKLRREVPEQQYHTTPCGISSEQELMAVKTAPSYDLVYLASFDWEPNVQGARWFLEQVWPLIIAKRPSTRFHLGGRHIPKSLKKWESDQIHISENVPSMQQFITNGKLVVIPLLAGSGMRIKIVENMALGLCQLSTRIGAEGISVEDGQNIHLADDPKEMADKAIALIEDETLRKKTGKAARKTAEKEYDNRKIGAKTLQFLREQIC